MNGCDPTRSEVKSKFELVSGRRPSNRYSSRVASPPRRKVAPGSLALTTPGMCVSSAVQIENRHNSHLPVRGRKSADALEHFDRKPQKIVGEDLIEIATRMAGIRNGPRLDERLHLRRQNQKCVLPIDRIVALENVLVKGVPPVPFDIWIIVERLMAFLQAIPVPESRSASGLRLARSGYFPAIHWVRCQMGRQTLEGQSFRPGRACRARRLEILFRIPVPCRDRANDRSGPVWRPRLSPPSTAPARSKWRSSRRRPAWQPRIWFCTGEAGSGIVLCWYAASPVHGRERGRLRQPGVRSRTLSCGDESRSCKALSDMTIMKHLPDVTLISRYRPFVRQQARRPASRILWK